MPEAIGRRLDLHDARIRYPTPGIRGWLQRTGDVIVEIVGSMVVSLALILLGLALVAVLVAVRS